MSNASTISKGIEPLHSNNVHLLCWKSVMGGVLISIMSFMLLTALGSGVLGMLAQSAVENEAGGSALATGSGLWMGISIVISLFMGSYFTVRVSKTVTNKVGAAHGFVVASIFFILMMIGAGTTIGALSSGFSSMVSGLSQGSANLASNPVIQDTVNNAIGNNTNLKSDPKVVAEGLLTRLIQGEPESAKSYLAYQTGMSQAEVDAKFTQLQSDFVAASKVVADKAAKAVAGVGMSLFVVFFVGLLSSLFAGRFAAHANVDRPLASADEAERATFRPGILANQNGSALPYLLGWLLGVPTSILFMVFLLRAVF